MKIDNTYSLTSRKQFVNTAARIFCRPTDYSQQFRRDFFLAPEPLRLFLNSLIPKPVKIGKGLHGLSFLLAPFLSPFSGNPKILLLSP